MYSACICRWIYKWVYNTTPTFSSPNPHYDLTFGSSILCQVLSGGRQRQIGVLPGQEIPKYREYRSDTREETYQYLTKERGRRYPAKTITDTDYANDIAILANAPAQAETLLHNLEQAAEGIGFHVNAHKTEYTCFNQIGDIFTLNGITLKLVGKFTYLGSSVSSTETDIDTRLAKTWTASSGYRSNRSQTWAIKWNAVSSKQRSCRCCYMDALHGR